MTRVARVVGAVAVAAAVAGCGGSKQAAPTTTPVAETTSARVYFVLDGRVQPVLRRVLKVGGGLHAWEALMRGPSSDEAKLGLTSAVVSDASSKLGTGSYSALSLTTVDQSRAALAQIAYTLTQFDPVTAVVVNGTRYTRADFEAETPAILVESPLPFQTVARPVRITGTANTFEATFQYELLDAAGKVIAKHFVTATSGSGTRGTFDVTIPYPAGPAGPGKLVVYENSAKDGSRIHIVEIPLRFSG